jgi:NAD(P) transhydrogenase subunit alpha
VKQSTRAFLPRWPVDENQFSVFSCLWEAISLKTENQKTENLFGEDFFRMSIEILISSLYVFALAAFLGYQVISRVPPLLHTPLMSATNAISAISVVGSLVTAGADYSRVSTILGFIAVISATINVVGGFMITDRMLRMFKEKTGGDKTGGGGGSNHKGGGRR